MITHQFLHSKRSSGFTLVEMLIYLNLLSVLLLFISRIFLTTLDVQVRSQSASSVQIDDQYVLSRLQYDIYRADAILTPANIGDVAGSLVMSIGGDTYTYGLSGGQLQLTTASGVEQVTSARTTMSSFTVERQGNIGGVPTLTVQYEITSVFSEDGTPETRATSVVLGNR